MSLSYWIGKNTSPYKRIVVGSCVQLTDGKIGEVRGGDLDKQTVDVKLQTRELQMGIPAKDVVHVDCPVWARNGGRRRMRTRKHRKARTTRKIRR
jgi:hypothetical protein